MDKAIFGLFSDEENNPITTSLGYKAVFLVCCIQENVLKNRSFHIKLKLFRIIERFHLSHGARSNG